MASRRAADLGGWLGDDPAGDASPYESPVASTTGHSPAGANPPTRSTPLDPLAATARAHAHQAVDAMAQTGITPERLAEADHYARHPYELDAASGQYFSASYDVVTGTLTLTSPEMRVDRWTPRGGAGLESRELDELVPPEPQNGPATVAEVTPPGKPPVELKLANDEGKNLHPHGLDDDEDAAADLPGTELPQRVGQAGLRSTTVVIREDGTRVRTESTRSAHVESGEVSLAVVEQTTTDASGLVRSSRNDRVATQVVDGTTLTSTLRVTEGPLGVERSEARLGASRGEDRWHESTATTWKMGPPTHMEATRGAVLDGVLSNETATSEYRAGVPTATRLDRTVQLPSVKGTDVHEETVEISYDGGGQVAEINAPDLRWGSARTPRSR